MFFVFFVMQSFWVHFDSVSLWFHIKRCSHERITTTIHLFPLNQTLIISSISHSQTVIHFLHFFQFLTFPILLSISYPFQCCMLPLFPFPFDRLFPASTPCSQSALPAPGITEGQLPVSTQPNGPASTPPKAGSVPAVVSCLLSTPAAFTSYGCCSGPCFGSLRRNSLFRRHKFVVHELNFSAGCSTPENYQ